MNSVSVSGEEIIGNSATRVPQLSVSFMGCIADEYCLMSTYSKACMYDCKERDEEERERGMKSVHKKYLCRKHFSNILTPPVRWSNHKLSSERLEMNRFFSFTQKSDFSRRSSALAFYRGFVSGVLLCQDFQFRGAWWRLTIITLMLSNIYLTNLATSMFMYNILIAPLSYASML